MSECRRVVVFAASLGGGGAERAAVGVCGWLRDAGHKVRLVTLSSVDTDFHRCPHEVERVGLDLQRPSTNPIDAIFAIARRVLVLRRTIQAHRADTVISLGDRSNVLMLLATIGLAKQKIISERGDPVLLPLSRGWAWLRRLTYPMATLHVSQSSYASDWIGNLFPSLPCCVIGNPASSLFTPPQKTRVPGVSVRFVAVGRLSAEKGFDVLLEAFARASHYSRVKLDLSVVGDGVDRDALISQASVLGIRDAVRFLGRLNDVHAQLQASDIFILPSRSEGFPNAMIEAMATGLPVIAARCRGGVEDILTNQKNRYALDFPPGDAEALASRMLEMVDDVELRRQLSEASIERAADYDEKKIAEAWNELVRTS